MITKEKILEALRNVDDPDLHKDIVTLGMVQDIVIDEEKLDKVKIIPVETIQEVMEYAMDWNGNKKLKEKIFNGKK